MRGTVPPWPVRTVRQAGREPGVPLRKGRCSAALRRRGPAGRRVVRTGVWCGAGGLRPLVRRAVPCSWLMRRVPGLDRPPLLLRLDIHGPTLRAVCRRVQLRGSLPRIAELRSAPLRGKLPQWQVRPVQPRPGAYHNLRVRKAGPLPGAAAIQEGLHGPDPELRHAVWPPPGVPGAAPMPADLRPRRAVWPVCEEGGRPVPVWSLGHPGRLRCRCGRPPARPGVLVRLPREEDLPEAPLWSQVLQVPQAKGAGAHGRG
jgi:hypothetical protein